MLSVLAVGCWAGMVVAGEMTKSPSMRCCAASPPVSDDAMFQLQMKQKRH